jgi:hypothetical protein
MNNEHENEMHQTCSTHVNKPEGIYRCGRDGNIKIHLIFREEGFQGVVWIRLV